MTTNPPEALSAAQWAERLGGVPLSRIVLQPTPGTATEKDIADQLDRFDIACELIEGVLIQKAMGVRKSSVIVALARVLGQFVEENKLGELGIEPGAVSLRPDLVLVPDISLYLKSAVAGPRIPDLCVGILSIANTRREIENHRDYLFAAGTRRFWLVDPSTRSLTVFAPLQPAVALKLGDSLAGADLLPGFQLKVADLFATLDRRGPRR